MVIHSRYDPKLTFVSSRALPLQYIEFFSASVEDTDYALYRNNDYALLRYLNTTIFGWQLILLAVICCNQMHSAGPVLPQVVLLCTATYIHTPDITYLLLHL